MPPSEPKYFPELREKDLRRKTCGERVAGDSGLDCLPEYNKQGLLESARKLAQVAAAPEFMTNEQ